VDRVGLLERREVLAQQVLRDRRGELAAVQTLNDGRHRLLLGELARLEPAVAGDEHVLAVLRLDQHRLEHPVLADAGGELVERLLRDRRARVLVLDDDVLDRQLEQLAIGGLGGHLNLPGSSWANSPSTLGVEFNP
jgi:hypothetical protein